MDLNATSFADLLRQHRRAAGLTQEELAEKAQVSPREISDLERGLRKHPWRETIQLLAAALRLGPTERAQWEVAARRGGPPAPGTIGLGTGHDALEPRHNLPVPVTSFVGRERELAEVRRLLAETHLLTLTGTGGCGKTRLALHVADDLVDACPDGIWLVEFAPLADPILVPSALATALGVREVPGRAILTTLVDFLHSRALLLVLDNCEHLLDACAHLADRLLRSCPKVRILATSREPLRVDGETVLRVPSLAAPRAETPASPSELAQFEAVQLFLDRASTARPGFTLTATNGVAIAEVCRRLDGIPLALELAAARLRALSVEQIAARLDQRFRLLTGGSRAALPRHQTLTALVDWSYDLLNEPEQTLFNRLAVFAGGFDLEAAEQVCSDPPLPAEDVLSSLTSLVEKSLVVVGDDGGQEGRYWLLETLRQFGWERLVRAGEADRVRDRHRDWSLALVERLAPVVHGPIKTASLERLTSEHDNLRAALAWCLERQADLGLQLAVYLSYFWKSRGYEGEERRWLEALLARATKEPLLRAQALIQIAVSLRDQGDFATAMTQVTEGLALAREVGSRSDTSQALSLLGSLATDQGDYARAKMLIRESLDLARPFGDYINVSLSLMHLGELTWYEGNYAVAQASFNEVLALARKAKDSWGIASGNWGLGVVAQSTGNLARAETLLRESVARWRAFGDKPGLGIALGDIGYLVGSKGDDREADAFLRESMRLFWEVGHRPRLARSLCFVGILAVHRGSYAVGVRLFAAAEAANRFLRAGLAPDEHADLDRSVATARATLDEIAFEQAWAAGQIMTLEEAMVYALAGDSG